MAVARSRGMVRAKPRTDAYVGLLIVSLIALCTASLFAYLDYASYPQTKPKAVQMAPRGGGGAAPQLAPGGPAVNPQQQQQPQIPPAPGKQPVVPPQGKK